MSLAPGARLGPYEILAPIGAGGMGEVHRARHLKLDRDVAIKVLPTALASDADRLARFEREARTASALNHPNIVTIHDVSEDGGTTWIAMELVEGRTLRELVAEGPLPVDRVLDLASQLADGLEKAHAAGIVHRDIKPANVMVTEDGLVKILDFGLAKALATPATPADPGVSAGAPEGASGRVGDTREGALVGTPHYMSPEQLEEGPVDHRSDQFAVGVVLYEMIGGERPFDGPSVGAVIGAILTRPPRPLGRLRRGVPRSLARIVHRCLEKDPAKRFPSTAELRAALEACERRRVRAEFVRGPASRRAAAALLLALFAGGWMWHRGAGARWAENEAPDLIRADIEAGRLYDAFRTSLEARRHRPDDPELERLFDRITLPVPVRTEPSGARVTVQAYGRPDSEWQVLGVTPVELRIPYAAMRWRIEKEGYEPFDGAPFSPGSLALLAGGVALDPVGTVPFGTVRIPAGRLEGPALIRPTRSLAGVEVGSFFLERYEVTNRQFETFVEAGGYRTPDGWPIPMERDGREVGWEEAMALFLDRTGHPGPSTWEAGHYPEGEGDHPVGGVSWFEAVAYCAFAGRSLPTIYHWFRALGQEQLSEILVHSNMDAEAKAPVGRHKGLSAYGTYDMAGNVKEWVWNATGHQRYILGGAWNEPTYLFKHLVAQDPWGREATSGVRCAEYIEPPNPALTAPFEMPREYARPGPVSEETFEVLRGLYVYDRDSLDARVERVDERRPDYRRETVSFRTAYGSGRMEVHLLIPRDVEPPYQSVIWFPGDDVFSRRSSDDFASAWLFDWIPGDGRVLVHPVYRGMYERYEPWDRTRGEWPDMMRSWRQDLGRTIDYLETRSDFDAGKIAYFGFSSGALYAPVFAAVEPRLAVSMFIGGGLIPMPLQPEMDPSHFGPRARTPTLMINGRDDFLMPFEIGQRPFFEMLGAPADLKRHARLTGGHIPTDTREIIGEVSDWLDRHLGPVPPGA